MDHSHPPRNKATMAVPTAPFCSSPQLLSFPGVAKEPGTNKIIDWSWLLLTLRITSEKQSIYIDSSFGDRIPRGRASKVCVLFNKKNFKIVMPTTIHRNRAGLQLWKKGFSRRFPMFLIFEERFPYSFLHLILFSFLCRKKKGPTFWNIHQHIHDMRPMHWRNAWRVGCGRFSQVGDQKLQKQINHLLPTLPFFSQFKNLDHFPILINMIEPICLTFPHRWCIL